MHRSETADYLQTVLQWFPSLMTAAVVNQTGQNNNKNPAPHQYIHNSFTIHSHSRLWTLWHYTQWVKKNCASTHSFITLTNVGRIFKFFSLLYSPRNLQENPCHIANHTLDVSLHYLTKCKITKLVKFCWI